MKIINYSEARNNLKSVMDSVFEKNEVTAITRNGNKPVVMISLDMYNALTNASHTSTKAVSKKKTKANVPPKVNGKAVLKQSGKNFTVRVAKKKEAK